MAILPPQPPTLYRSTDALHITLTLPAPSQKYPAKQHARNVAARLPSNDGIIFLSGATAALLEDSDMPVPFRQRRYFLYLSGVTDMADCALTYRIDNDVLTLYIPPLDPAAVLWSGMPLGEEECLLKYDIDVCKRTPSLARDLQWFNTLNPTSPLYHLPSHPPPMPAITTLNSSVLKPAIDTCRVYKSPHEISLIRRANAITTHAHAAVLAAVRSGAAKTEAAAEAAFIFACISRFAKTQAYEPILGAGRNAATLHYTRNTDPLCGRQLLLIDAAAEWEGYAADVTRTIPISGTFTPEAGVVYALVEKMQAECIARVVAGKDFFAAHVHAHRVAIRGLLEMGVLTGGSEEKIFEAGTSRAFFPHGLGHMLGLDVHDVELPLTNAAVNGVEGVYATVEHPLRGGARIMAPRVLEEGMVVTVEPGIYFCEWIIKSYLKNPVHARYIDTEVLERFWDVGGVRIEDDILVLAPGKGNENLTTATRW